MQTFQSVQQESLFIRKSSLTQYVHAYHVTCLCPNELSTTVFHNSLTKAVMSNEEDATFVITGITGSIQSPVDQFGRPLVGGRTTATGTISNTAGSATITGVGTLFTTELQVGDPIFWDDEAGVHRSGVILSITSATVLTLTAVTLPGAATDTNAYTRVALTGRSIFPMPGTSGHAAGKGISVKITNESTGQNLTRLFQDPATIKLTPLLPNDFIPIENLLSPGYGGGFGQFYRPFPFTYLVERNQRILFTFRNRDTQAAGSPTPYFHRVSVALLGHRLEGG